MKFSYKLIKQFIPQLKSVEQLRDLLTMHAFEVDAVIGDMVDIKILPNRFSDAASHWGIAEEVAVILDVKPKIPKFIKHKIDIEVQLPRVTIEDKKMCPRYIARAVEIAKMVKTPDWMKEALTTCGMRPINIVVDMMNYVMLEVGQPMHAFDAKKMNGIIVKHAATGEHFESLDKVRYALTPDDLVIADDNGTLAIAGIKGGTTAEVTNDTRSFILESANFDHVAIYRTSQRLQLKTDASQRFTHTLAPALAWQGMERATQLLIELCGARVSEAVDIYAQRKKPIAILFDYKKFVEFSGLKRFTEEESFARRDSFLESRLGLSITKAQALHYLKRLGFIMRGNMVIAPEYRTDIEHFEDLVDEIVRLHGYENLPSIAPRGSLVAAQREQTVVAKESLRELLSRAGLYEVYNYSFTSERDASKGDVEVLNPVSADFAYLRSNLHIALKKNIESALHHQSEIGLFELGKVFTPEERLVLGIARGSKREYQLRELKGIIIVLSEALGVTVELSEKENKIKIQSGSEEVGLISLARGEGKEYIVIAELYIEKLLTFSRRAKIYKAIFKFPSIDRDISFLVGKDKKVGGIIDTILNMHHKTLLDILFVDQFEDVEKIGKDKKSVTLRLVFQSSERTLTDIEVDVVMQDIVTQLKLHYSVEVR